MTKVTNTRIHHIKTGGTIGGCVPEYPEIEFLANTFPDMTNLDKFLTQSLKVFAEYTEHTVCHKDSRAITEEDRLAIKNEIEHKYKEGVRKFIITHGTYTMPDTGKFLLKNLSPEISESIQVIITGSMFPWTLLGSDAPLNLGATFGILINTSNPTIALCMHGKLFDPLKVRKDVTNLIFTEE
jgi:L-asparaginase